MIVPGSSARARVVWLVAGISGCQELLGSIKQLAHLDTGSYF